MNVIKMTNLRLSKMNYADIKEEYEAVIEIPEENVLKINLRICHTKNFII